jgi:hypothetical protein
MSRLPQTLVLALSALALAGCLALTMSDTSGAFYGVIRGTVTRTGGAVVPKAPIGVSCVGSTNEPFGFTTDADADGKFEVNVNGLSYFAPLEGPAYVCRVLTPYTGVPQAEKSITVRVGSSRDNRPVTAVSLVTP